MDKALKHSLSHRARSLELVLAHFAANPDAIDAEIKARAAAGAAP
jgi:hypothetical protein